MIGQIFPKYGLGTQATRGEIIKKIQSKGYVVKDKKTGQLTPTNKAYLLINYLYDNEFSDPETTGGWENVSISDRRRDNQSTRICGCDKR